MDSLLRLKDFRPNEAHILTLSENTMEHYIKVDITGLEIIEAPITHLTYAIDIASAMLQRQQAKANIDTRQMIVKGAVIVVVNI